MLRNKIASHDEWIAARKELRSSEKEFTRLRDELSRRRRELPWVKVEKSYVFDGEKGKETLADLFDGRSQLIVYHFMFAPEWSQGCKSCSLLADHYNPAIVHLNHRGVSMVTVSRAPLEKLLAFRERMGWTFKWVSSFDSDFNYDFHVTFTAEELNRGTANYNYDDKPFPVTEAPGISVFFKDDDGIIFHTYSSYARGLDILLALTIFSISFPRDGMRKGCQPWRGLGTTIDTAIQHLLTRGWSDPEAQSGHSVSEGTPETSNNKIVLSSPSSSW